MCGTIPMVYMDRNHYYDLKWRVVSMSRIIAMISTEELKSLLMVQISGKKPAKLFKRDRFSTAKNNNFILHLSK